MITAVKRIQFFSDRMSHLMLRGCCCDFIVLNVQAPTEEKFDDIKDSFYEEPECAFD
jgi:hypothetical protein